LYLSPIQLRQRRGATAAVGAADEAEAEAAMMRPLAVGVVGEMTGLKTTIDATVAPNSIPAMKIWVGTGARR